MAAESQRLGIVENLAESLGVHANSQSIFGQPVEREGVTVLPVGKLRYGLGGGSGGKEAAEQGAGGGGGIAVSPVGYIEIAAGRSRFRRFDAPIVILRSVVVLAFGGLLLMRGYRKARSAA